MDRFVCLSALVAVLCVATRRVESTPIREDRGGSNLVKMSLCKDFRVNQELWEAFCGVQGTGKRSSMINEEKVIDSYAPNEPTFYQKHPDDDLQSQLDAFFRMFLRDVRQDDPGTPNAPMYII